MGNCVKKFRDLQILQKLFGYFVKPFLFHKGLQLNLILMCRKEKTQYNRLYERNKMNYPGLQSGGCKAILKPGFSPKQIYQTHILKKFLG